MTNNEDSNPTMTKRDVNRNFLLCDILVKIGSGHTPIEIANGMGWSRQRMRPWIKRLEKAGLIVLKFRDKMNVYGVTELGKKFTIGNGHGSIVLHHVQYSYPIIKFGNLSPDHRWKASGVEMWFEQVDSKASIRGNHESVQINISSIINPDPFKAEDEAKNLADRCVEILRQRGFELGQGHQSKKPHYGVLDPIMRRMKEHMQIRTEDGEMDKSGEEDMEFYTPERVAEYMKMPLKIKELEQHLIRQTEIMDKFSKQIELHLSAIQGINEGIKELRDAVREMRK